MFDAASSYLEDNGFDTSRMSEKAVWSAIDRLYRGGRNAFKREIARYCTV